MHPLLSLNSRAMQGSLLDYLKSLSRSLMIHATVLSRPWPCSWEMFNLWTKHMKSIPSSSNQSSKLFEATRSDRVTKFQKKPALFLASASFGTSGCTTGALTYRTGWEGYSTWSKSCWTVSKDSDSPHHFHVDLSFWEKFDTLVQRQIELVQRQPVVQNCSKLLPAKPPFQQVAKSCKDLQSATPAFAHRDTSCKLDAALLDTSHRSPESTLWSILQEVGNSCICTPRYFL